MLQIQWIKAQRALRPGKTFPVGGAALVVGVTALILVGVARPNGAQNRPASAAPANKGATAQNAESKIGRAHV